MHYGRFALVWVTVSSSILFSCGGSNSPAAPAAVAGNQAFNASLSAMNSALAGVGAILPAAPTSIFSDKAISPNASALTNGAITTHWNNAALLPHPKCSGGGGDPHCGQNVSLKTFMSFQTDANARRDNGSSVNVFGRLQNSLSQLCAIMNLSPNLDSNGYPVNGTQSAIFTAEMNNILVNNCGFAADDIPPTGTVVSVTTNDSSDTANYDKIIPLDDGQGTLQTFHIRSNSTTVNILSIEDNTTDHRISRSTIALDRTTGKVRAEYVTAPYTAGSSDAIEFQRVYFDKLANDAAILSYTRDFHTPTPNRWAYTMVGHPSTPSAAMALGFRAGAFGGFTWGTDIFGACITQSTGVIASDATLACSGVTGVAVDAAGPDGIFTDLNNNVYTGTDAGKRLNNGSRTVNFTSSANIFTTLVSHTP